MNIIELAKQAGFADVEERSVWISDGHWDEELKAFAVLVAAHEREECIKAILSGTDEPVQTKTLKALQADRLRIARDIAIGDRKLEKVVEAWLFGIKEQHMTGYKSKRAAAQDKMAQPEKRRRTMDKDDTLKLALEFVDDVHFGEWQGSTERQEEVVTVINKALAQPAQEPVARCCWHDSDCAIHNMPAYPAGPCNCTRLARLKEKNDA
jgi:hypothetical protein